MQHLENNILVAVYARISVDDGEQATSQRKRTFDLCHYLRIQSSRAADFQRVFTISCRLDELDQTGRYEESEIAA